MFGIDPLYLIIVGGSMLLSRFVSMRLQQKFAHYSRVPMELSGKEIAEKMLRDSGINDVKIISVNGQLTDHYNPRDKTVNLSEVVYHQRNFAAAAVSAHECGHAIQHAKAYGALKMRSNLVPMVNVSSKLAQWVLMAGIAVYAFAQFPWVLVAGIVLFSFSTLFAFVTLPVEFDASRRALAWLKTSGFSSDEGQAAAKDALKWAAMTYVVAALASLGQLLYYIMILMRRR